MRYLFCSFFLLLFAGGLSAQNVAVNTDGSAPDPKALLDVKSNTKGVLFPRMTAAERNQLVNLSPAGVPLGLIVFQTDGGADQSGLYFNASAISSIPNWKKLSSTDQLFWDFSSGPPATIYNNDNWNIGIGTTTAAAKLHVSSASLEKLRLENTTALNTGVTNGLVFKTGNYITGMIRTIGTASNAARMTFYTYASIDTANLKEQMSILDNGNVGIGTTTPAEKLEISKGRILFRGNQTSGNAHGITWTNNAGTLSRAFVGQYDDNTFGFYGFGGAGWNFLWDVTDGSLRLGTTQKAAGYLLNIGGKAIAEEVRVQLRGSWPDYVFRQNYSLMPLSQLESYIQQHQHLPNIPKADVLEKDGTDLGEMQRKMMEKIEELTLYVIELKKEIGKQQEEIQKLKEKQ